MLNLVGFLSVKFMPSHLGPPCGDQVGLRRLHSAVDRYGCIRPSPVLLGLIFLPPVVLLNASRRIDYWCSALSAPSSRRKIYTPGFKSLPPLMRVSSFTGSLTFRSTSSDKVTITIYLSGGIWSSAT